MRRPNRRPNYTEMEDVTNWEETADYIIHKDGSVVICIDGDTGKEVSKSTTVATPIQYALTKLTSGGHLHIKRGTYALASKLTMDSDLLLTGDGVATLLQAAAAMNDNVLHAVSKNDIIIQDLAIDGNKANQTYTPTMKTTGVADVDEIHCNGIYCNACTNVKVLHCKVYNTIHNAILYYNGCTECLVDGCYVYGTDWHGVEFWHAATFCSICNSVTKNCWKEPIVVELGNTRYCSVLNNTISDDGSGDSTGILISNCDRCAVIGNILYDSVLDFSAGKYCTCVGNVVQNSYLRTTFNTDHTIFMGNMIHAGGSYGGHLMSLQGDEIICTNNYLWDGGSEGIHIHVCDKGIFTNNYINDCVGVAITEQAADCDYNLIANNYLENNGGTMTINGANTIVRDNMGYITEKSGASGVIADGGTIAHGLATTPTHATITGTVAGEIVNVTALGAANLTIAIKTNAGAAGTNQVIYWRAWV